MPAKYRAPRRKEKPTLWTARIYKNDRKMLYRVAKKLKVSESEVVRRAIGMIHTWAFPSADAPTAKTTEGERE